MDAVEWTLVAAAAGWTALLAGLMLSSMERPLTGPHFRIWRPPRTLPSATETRASINRFRQARERWELMDFVWDRFDRGRALIPEHPKIPRHSYLNEILSRYLPHKTTRKRSR